MASDSKDRALSISARTGVLPGLVYDGERKGPWTDPVVASLSLGRRSLLALVALDGTSAPGSTTYASLTGW